MATFDALDSTTNESSPPGSRPRKRRWLRAVAWTAACLVVLIVLGVAFGLWWLRSRTIASLPVLDGDVHLAGLSAPVIVRRDAHGVPHIEAASQDDLFLGVMAGWETQIGRDFDTGKHLGYRALTNAGYSATRPPADAEK